MCCIAMENGPFIVDIGDLPIKNGGLEHLDDLSIQLGMLSSQLTKSYFSEG